MARLTSGSCRVGRQLVVLGPDRARVVRGRSGSGRTTGVLAIARIAPVRRVEGDDRAAPVAEAGHRGLLGPAVEGQHDVAAARVPAGEQRREPAGEQPVVAAGQQAVLRLLHAGGAEDQRVEAGDRRVRRLARVLPQVLQLVLGRAPTRRPACRRRRACRAAARTRRAGPGCCAGRRAACRPRTPGRSWRWREQPEQDQHRQRDPPDRPVHRVTTSVMASASGGCRTGVAGGRRAASEIRSSSATSAKLATSDEPP